MAIFSLQEVKKLQVQNVIDDNLASWPEIFSTYGYFIGGSPSTSIVRRLDYSNDTTKYTPGAPVPLGGFAVVTTDSYAYTGGEFGSVSTIRRMDYFSETFSLPGNNLPTIHTFGCGAQSDSYGYFSGGGYYSNITRLDFSNETIGIPGNNLPETVRGHSSFSNSSYGYFVGGESAFNVLTNTTRRLDFSAETVSLPGTNMNTSYEAPSGKRTNQASISTSDYGYISGGYTFPTPAPGAYWSDNDVSKFDFSNESYSYVNNLSTIPGSYGGRNSHGAVNSSSYGYHAGGTYYRNTPPFTSFNTSTISKHDFATNIFSETSSPLGDSRSGLKGIVGGSPSFYNSLTKFKRISFADNINQKTHGYAIGGETPPGPPYGRTTAYKLTFSTETVSLPGSDSPIPITFNTYNSFGNRNYGYVFGGRNPSFSPPPANSYIQNVRKFDHATDFYTFVQNLGLYRELSSSRVHNQNYGYIIGGYTQSSTSVPFTTFPTSERARFDFSNEVRTSIPGHPSVIVYVNGFSQGSYSYFSSYTPTDNSSLSRLDFSTEVASTLGKYWPSARNSYAMFKNNIYGYQVGGICTISRLDFSNETISNPGNNLPAGRYSMSSMSSNFYGYSIGGYGPSYHTTITRLDFSNETLSDPGNNLPQTRTSLSSGSVNADYS